MGRPHRAAHIAGFVAPLVLGAALLAGCAQTGTHRAWGRSGELSFTEGEDIDSLNPTLTTELVVTDLSALTQGYLFLPDDKNRLMPSLCTKVPTLRNHLISPNGKTIVYELRRGVRWQDGAPFTAADIAFSLKTILTPSYNDADPLVFEQVASLQTPNPYTVVVHLKAPYAPFVSQFFTPNIGSGILPEHLLAGKNILRSAWNALPIGLGPFKYVRWIRGSRVEMIANDHWWGGRPKLRRIVYRIIPDSSTAITELRTHELDAYARVPDEEYPQAKAVPDTRTFNFPTTGYEHIDFNLQSPVLRDLRVRRAIAHAIDRASIVDKVDHGAAYLACSPIPHTSWAYDPQTPCVDFNPNRARALLSAAGWHMQGGLRRKNGKALRLTMVSTTGNLSRDESALMIQSQLSKVGIALRYVRYSADEMFAHQTGILASGKFDLALYAWFFGSDPDMSAVYGCAALAPSGNNDSRYCNKRFDALSADALTHFGVRRRAADYARIQQMLARDLPSLVLYQYVDHLTISRAFRHIDPGPQVLFTNPQRIAEDPRARRNAEGPQPSPRH